MESTQISQSIDARGSACPGPLMELIKAVRSAEVGSFIELFTSEKGSASDVPSWLNKVGQKLVDIEELSDHWRIIVQKVK